MLPDVGMVKVYPKYVSLKANVLQCHGIHLLVPGLFPPVGFSMQQHQTLSTSPTSLLVSVGNILLPLFLYFLCSASYMTHEHEPCTCKLALNASSHKHMSEYDSLYDSPCASVSHASRQNRSGIRDHIQTGEPLAIGYSHRHPVNKRKRKVQKQRQKGKRKM